MSTIKSSAEDLTLNADGSGNDIKFQSNAVEKASLSDAGLLTTSGGASLDGAVTINSSNADVDFKVGCETGATNVDTPDYALWVEGSTGNVICGDDTSVDDGYNFQLIRSGAATLEIYASADSSARDASLYLHTRNGGAQCRIRFRDGAAPGTTAGEIYYNHDGDTLYFHTANTQRAQINANGLCFGTDTDAANALDDYEEGTWTATITCGTSGTITLDSSFDLMNYTKIGNLCHISGRIKVSSISSPVGEIGIAGLPYAGSYPGEGAGHQYIGVHFRGAVSDVGAVSGQISTSSINVYEAGTTGNTNVDDKIDGGTYIMIGGTYRAA